MRVFSLPPEMPNDPDDFNCLFCFCPLYTLGDRCGGNFTFTKDGIKNCKDCLFPHLRKNYDGSWSGIRDRRGGRREHERLGDAERPGVAGSRRARDPRCPRKKFDGETGNRRQLRAAPGIAD